MSETDKHVIITGGAQGIGESLRRTVKSNYTVSVFDIDNEAIDEPVHIFSGKTVISSLQMSPMR